MQCICLMMSHVTFSFKTDRNENHIKEISKTAQNSLVILQDIICKHPVFAAENCSWKMAKEIVFYFHNFARAYSYGLTIPKNVEFNYLYHFKGYFHVFDSSHTFYKSAFEFLQWNLIGISKIHSCTVTCLIQHSLRKVSGSLVKTSFSLLCKYT